MNLTNEELFKLSDPNVPQSVKDHICEPKLNKEEIACCRQLGISFSDYCITKTVDPIK